MHFLNTLRYFQVVLFPINPCGKFSTNEDLCALQFYFAPLAVPAVPAFLVSFYGPAIAFTNLCELVHFISSISCSILHPTMCVKLLTVCKIIHCV